MEFKDVIFYNYGQESDLWSSREFIKILMKVLSASNFYYAHRSASNLFFDFDGLTSMFPDYRCMATEPYLLYGNSLYINTQQNLYGRTMNIYKRMFNNILAPLDINFRFIDTEKHYVAQPDYGRISDRTFTNVNGFIYDHATQPIVLINNDTYNRHVIQFAFTPVIKKLAEAYKEVCFIITSDYPNKEDNVVLSSDIIKKISESPVVELSYLSQYVDVIVGRNSSTYNFTQIASNYNNPDMHFLGLTPDKESAHVLSQEDSRANLYWSTAVREEELLDAISGVIEKVIP